MEQGLSLHFPLQCPECAGSDRSNTQASEKQFFSCESKTKSSQFFTVYQFQEAPTLQEHGEIQGRSIFSQHM